jgi:hypothetical protein
MKYNLRNIVWIAVCIASSAGCSNPYSPPPLPPQVQGTVVLEDSAGAPIPPPYSGITVSIPNANLATSTDSLGNWSFQTVPSGIYGLVASKAGFSNNIVRIQTQPYSTIIEWFTLTNAPDSIVRLDRAFQFWGDTDLISISATSKAPHVYFFIDRNPNVAPDSVHFIGPIECQQGNTIQWGGEFDLLYEDGFKGGDTAYVSACAVPDPRKFAAAGNYYRLTNAGPISNVIPIVIQ